MNELIEQARAIAAILKARGQTISVSESSTGGLVSACLLAIPGASAYYLGGAVVYTRRARALLSGIPDASMQGIRSSSEPYAQLLARTSRERFGATWALAETGVTAGCGAQWSVSRLKTTPAARRVVRPSFITFCVATTSG